MILKTSILNFGILSDNIRAGCQGEPLIKVSYVKNHNCVYVGIAGRNSIRELLNFRKKTKCSD